MLFSIVAMPVYISTNNVGGFSFFMHSPACDILRFLNYSHSDQREVVLHYSFDLYFSKNE